MSNATRPLSRCYLRSYLVKKNSAGAHKEPNKKYKNNLRTLKSKLRAIPNGTRVLHEYNNKAPLIL